MAKFAVVMSLQRPKKISNNVVEIVVGDHNLKQRLT